MYEILKKLKSSNFWVSMISAVVLILQAVFNVEIKTEYLNQIIMAILGLLVMSGIVSDGSTEEVTVKQNVDVEDFKQNVTNIFTQVASTFQTNLTGFIKQFEVIKENLTGASEALKTGETKEAENLNGIKASGDISNITEDIIEDNYVNLITPNIAPTQKPVVENSTIVENDDNENVL